MFDGHGRYKLLTQRVWHLTRRRWVARIHCSTEIELCQARFCR